MAQKLNDLIVEGFEKFEELGEDKIKEMSQMSDEYKNCVKHMDTLRGALQVDPASEMKGVVEDIDKAMQNCLQCHEMLEAVGLRQNSIPVRKKDLKDIKKGWAKELLKGARSITSLVEEGLSKPVLFKEHLCPLGLLEPPTLITDYHLERLGRDGAPVLTNDSIVMGAQELLDLADRQGEDMVLLTGKTEKDGYEEYITLDLQRDKVNPEEIVYSCDIDSMIWITQRPKFVGPLGIYASPMIRNRAPIWKNNHVRVEFLFPQSEEKRERSGPREEWWTKPWSLSNIPHLYFGIVSQGTSTVDILLFFPQMAHKDPHRHFFATKIPKHIQNILWDQIILPALRSVLEETATVYFPLDREHSMFKEGLGKNTKRVPLYPLQGEKMMNVVNEMRRIVSKD